MSQGFDIVVRDRISASIANKLNRIEAAATRANAAIQALNAGGGAQAINAVGNSAQSATSRVLAFALGLGRAQSAASILTNSMRSTGQSLRAFASGILLLGATGGVIEQVDSYRTLQNQIRTTTTSQEQMNEVTRQMFEVANEARVPVDSLTTNFVRYDKALQKLGFGQQKSIDLTETIAKALTLSGANATEASSAMTQLSQAFNKGKLDGDEFKTTTELFPSLLGAMSVAMGKPIPEIYKLSKAGKIGVGDLVKTFDLLKTKVDADFANMPRTIGQSFTQLANNVKKAFGEFDNNFGFTDAITSFLDNLGNNLPTVVNWLKAFGAAAAVMLVPTVIAMFGPLTSALLSLPGLVAAGAAYLAFFSDEILVTNDEVTTLTDLLGVLATNFKQLIGATIGVNLDDIFNAENAQALYDSIVSVGGEIQKAIQATIAWSGAFGEFLAAASFRNGEFTLDFLFEPINYLFATIKNGLLEIPIQFIEAFREPITAVMGFIDAVIKKIGQLATALAGISPFGGGALREFGSSLAGGLGQPTDSTDFLTKGLKALKTNPDDELPQFQKGIEAFDKAFQANLDSMQSASKSFWDEIILQSQSAADIRIANEAKVKEASKPNQDALRQDNQTGQSAQTAELARFAAALEDATTKSKRLKDILTDRPGVSFGDSFKIQAVEAALAADNFSKSIIEMGLGLKPIAQDLQTINTGLEQFKGSTNQGTSVIPPPPPAPPAPPVDIEQLNAITASSNLAATAVAGISTSITDVTNASATMGSSASSDFNLVASSASSAGSTISSSISSAMQAASSSVSSFASQAISDLNAVASAASSIQAPSGFGGGGFFGFASGGYTGNGGVNEVAGVVHGQEFVMPADMTSKYRPLLEAMRAGKVSPSSGATSSVGIGTGLNVSVHNYGSSKISVERLSESDIRIIAREEGIKAARTEGPLAVANTLRNPNSKVSKAFSRNTNTERRR